MPQRQCVICKCERYEDELRGMCQDCAGTVELIRAAHGNWSGPQVEHPQYLAEHEARIVAHAARVVREWPEGFPIDPGSRECA